MCNRKDDNECNYSCLLLKKRSRALSLLINVKAIFVSDDERDVDRQSHGANTTCAAIFPYMEQIIYLNMSYAWFKDLE